MEGEAAGPDYSQALQDGREAEEHGPMVNGVLPTAGATSTGHGNNVSGETGLGATTYGTMPRVDRDPERGEVGVGLGGSSGVVQQAARQQQQPQHPALRLAGPRQPAAQQQPLSMTSVPAAAQQQPLPMTSVPAAAQQQPLPMTSVPTSAEHTLEPTLSRSLASNPTGMNAERPSTFYLPTHEENLGRTLGDGEYSEGYVTATGGYMDEGSEQRSTRSMMLSFGQMMRRRVVAPMEQLGYQAWHAVGGPGRDRARQEPLLPQELQRAMNVHTERASLISPQHQSPGEDTSSASLNQEVVVEEVRRQVRAALAGREAEIQELRRRNEELQQALREAARPSEGAGPETFSQGPSRLSGEEPGGNLVGSGGCGSGAFKGFDYDGVGRVGTIGNLLNPQMSSEHLRGGLCGADVGFVAGDGRRVGARTQEGAKQGPGESESRSRAGATSQAAEAVEPLQLLVQGMRQLQQAYIGKSEHKDADLKGTVEVPALPELGPETAVEFSDWLFEAQHAIGGLSEKAGEWFEACVKLAKNTYDIYQVSTPLQRLALEPILTPELMESKWMRLEKRTMTLLLGAMTKSAKEDTITHRVNSVAGVLYRLHVMYQPGGAAERSSILRQLEGSQGSENAHTCIASLRKWKRYLQRASDMGIVVPDASLLLKGLELIASRAVETNPDVKFRLALSKNELQLQHRPDLESVLKYHNHILAELQQIAPTRTSRPSQPSSSETTRLKGLSATPDTGGSASPTSPAKKGSASQNTCKFFLQDSGCRRGKDCKYAHEFASKEEKKSRCWVCGARNHRQSECPAKSQNKALRNAGDAAESPKAGPKSTTPKNKDQEMLQNQQAILNSLQATLAAVGVSGATSSTSETPAIPVVMAKPVVSPETTLSTMSTAETATSDDRRQQDIRALIDEANAMLSKITKLQSLQVWSEPLNMEEVEAKMKMLGYAEEERTALLDSGATHPFRMGTEEELSTAQAVKVELADGKVVTLKQNKAGTLMPTRADIDQSSTTTIVPLGALVQQLGCELLWNRNGLVVRHPEFGELKTFVQGNYPLIGEVQALELISQLEERKLEQLKLKQTSMQACVNLALMEMDYDWDHGINNFVQTGEAVHLWKALASSTSPMGKIGENMQSMMASSVDFSDKMGWKYLKAFPLRRATRKTLMEKRWCVRLFAKEGDQQLHVKNEKETVVLDVNVHRSFKFDMLGANNPVYKALLWAAGRGQLEGVMASPATTTNSTSQTGHECHLKLLLLWLVAKEGARWARKVTPYFLMNMEAESEFWKSAHWKAFQQESQIPVVQMVSAKYEGSFYVATNLDVYKLDEDWSVALKPKSPATTRWTKEFAGALAKAIDEWKRMPDPLKLFKFHGDLATMTENEKKRWVRHLQNGHVPFDKRCKTCVETAATGRAHRRVLAPSAYCLSVDLSGPFRRKGELAEAQGYRYGLIGAYVFPKIRGCKDYEIPEDPLDEGAGVGPLSDEPYDEDYLEEVKEEEAPLDDETKQELEEANEKFKKLFHEIGDKLEYQVIQFAVPLRTRVASEIEEAIRHLYLQLRAEGLPVTRIHSDRARELRGTRLRRWLLEHDVLPTTGEAQTPQTNGRAEAAVRLIKARTKVILKMSQLPIACWPWAMTHAAWAQREHALGRGSKVIPFGAKVHVKDKVWPIRSGRDLSIRWKEGQFVGPATDVPGGFVVRFPDGKYTTTMHMRPNLLDVDNVFEMPHVEATLPIPGERLRAKTRLRVPEDARDAPEPKGDVASLPHGGPSIDARDAPEPEGDVAPLPHGGPSTDVRDAPEPEGDVASLPHGGPKESARRRRLREKTALRLLEPMSEEEQGAENLAKDLYSRSKFTIEDVTQLYGLLQKCKQKRTKVMARQTEESSTTWSVGMFTHGGISGIRASTKRMPEVTRYLVSAAKHLMELEHVGAIIVAKNARLGLHRDSNNEVQTVNAVLPLTNFEGGGVWVQHDDEILEEKEEDRREVRPGVWVGGIVNDLKKGQPFRFNPRRWHAVEPHEGERVVMIAYTPRSSKLTTEDRSELMKLGFNIPEPRSQQDEPEENRKELVPKEVEEYVLDEEWCSRPMRKPKAFEGIMTGHNVPPEEDKDSCYDIEDGLLCLNEAQRQLIEDLQTRSQSLQALLEEEEDLMEDLQAANRGVECEARHLHGVLLDLLSKTSDFMQQEDKRQTRACLRAAAAHVDPDYERLLEELSGPLQVVHTVPLTQVRPVVEKWRKSIVKEINQLFSGGTLVKIDAREAKRQEALGLIRIVPSKGVFTLKPPAADSSDWYRRKYRLVLCGNYVALDDATSSLYAGGASAETFRTVLAMASRRRWRGAASDITGAFLLADWPPGMPSYAVQPPKMLVEMGLANANEYWLVQRPLYGLRESPSIWAAYRSARFAKARIPYKEGYIVLKASTADPELWLAFYIKEGVSEERLQEALKEERNDVELIAMVITYVDDLFYLSDDEVVGMLHGWVQSEWPCSALEWANAEGGARYLGLEVYQRESGEFEVKQEGYILDLVRAHDLMNAPQTLLPCPKEWITEELDAEPENFTESELRHGQRMVGEQLWLAMRSRPDIQYVVNYMSSWVSKQPVRVARIATRVLMYLHKTAKMILVLGQPASSNSSSSSSEPATFRGVTLTGFSDASFAPFGSKSFGASVVTVNATPVSWRCGKQQFVTLSVMEAELVEAAEASLLLENVGCLIDELMQSRTPRLLLVDNSSAVAMLLGGQGSWRTRHLRVRSQWVRERVQRGELLVQHVCGQRQLADLATKMHGKARLWELLKLWSLQELPDEAKLAEVGKVLVLLCLARFLETVPGATAADAFEAEDEAEPLQSGMMPSMNLTQWDELLVVSGVACVAAIAIWELLKRMASWLMSCFKVDAKQRRLRKLRHLARAAAEAEVERSFGIGGDAMPSPQQVESAVQGAYTRVERRHVNAMSASTRSLMVDSSCQTDLPLLAPQNVPLYQPFNGPFFLTDQGDVVHVHRNCQGFNSAYHAVRSRRYCVYCARTTPLGMR